MIDGKLLGAGGSDGIKLIEVTIDCELINFYSRVRKVSFIAKRSCCYKNQKFFQSKSRLTNFKCFYHVTLQLFLFYGCVVTIRQSAQFHIGKITSQNYIC